MADRVDQLLALATEAERKAANMRSIGDIHAARAFSFDAETYLLEAEEYENERAK